MNGQALNFATQALESLETTYASYERKLPLAFRNIRNIMAILREAVKFNLPDDGRLFDDDFRALPAVFRLPFPVVATEFRMVSNAPDAQQPMHHIGASIQTSSRRIALAVEIDENNYERFEWLIPPQKLGLLEDDGHVIAIISIYYNDEAQRWQISPFGALMPNQKIDPNPLATTRTEAVFDGTLPKGVRLTDLSAHLAPLMPEYCMMLIQEKGIGYAMKTMAQDTHDEMHAILGLVEILACNNVTTETVPASRALNKKRLGKGKPPFFEYKILLLEPSSTSVASPAQAGSHASPRVHLRRGHIRRLPERTVWVNAAVVGNKKAGVIVKDYAVTPGKN